PDGPSRPRPRRRCRRAVGPRTRRRARRVSDGARSHPRYRAAPCACARCPCGSRRASDRPLRDRSCVSVLQPLLLFLQGFRGPTRHDRLLAHAAAGALHHRVADDRDHGREDQRREPDRVLEPDGILEQRGERHVHRPEQPEECGEQERAADRHADRAARIGPYAFLDLRLCQLYFLAHQRGRVLLQLPEQLTDGALITYVRALNRYVGTIGRDADGAAVSRRTHRSPLSLSRSAPASGSAYPPNVFAWKPVAPSVEHVPGSWLPAWLAIWLRQSPPCVSASSGSDARRNLPSARP